MILAPTLKQIDERIEQCCHETEKKDTHEQPIHFKEVKGHSDTINISS